MAKTEKKPKEPKEKLTLADNPSLIKAGEEIHLRVLDDFFIETDLPKWKQFKADWEDLKKQLKIRYDGEAESIIKQLEDPKQQEEYTKRLQAYKAGQKKLDDDRWHIQSKHEQSVNASLQKTVRLLPKESLTTKLLTKLGLKKKLVPVEIAFEDLKSHLLHTTTAEMASKMAVLEATEKKFRDLGQYNKADQIKAYRNQVVEESGLIAAGFDTYVTEQMMIDFIAKSERGVMVDFLRYYDGIIPDHVAEIKKKADATMIFDNYVIAYYSDVKKSAEKAQNKEKKKAADKAIAQRRDPIMFGIVKESRKLFVIADWVTEDDDLTVAVLEEVLGQSKKTLTGESSPVNEITQVVNNYFSGNIDASTTTATSSFYVDSNSNRQYTYDPRPRGLTVVESGSEDIL